MKRTKLLSGFGIAILVAIPAICTAQRGTKKKGKWRLPAAVSRAIKSECPDCVIQKATRETDGGVTLYQFDFMAGKGEMDVAADGSIIQRETIVQTSDVPAAALDGIRKSGGTIERIERDEVRAEIRDGKLIKLDTPKYLYEVDLVKRNQNGELFVTPEGQVTEGPTWQPRPKKTGKTKPRPAA